MKIHPLANLTMSSGDWGGGSRSPTDDQLLSSITVIGLDWSQLTAASLHTDEVTSQPGMMTGSSHGSKVITVVTLIQSPVWDQIGGSQP